MSGKTRARPGPNLTYFEDRGAVYDAPLDAVWEFMTKDETFHPHAHKGTVRNFKEKSLGPLTTLLSWEERKGGAWRRRSGRFTTIPPAVRIQQDLEGPWTGSTVVYLYSPRGSRTAVDVLCYMRSATLTPKEIEAEWRKTLANAFREDLPWFRKFVRARGGKD